MIQMQMQLLLLLLTRVLVVAVRARRGPLSRVDRTVTDGESRVAGHGAGTAQTVRKTTQRKGEWCPRGGPYTYNRPRRLSRSSRRDAKMVV